MWVYADFTVTHLSVINSNFRPAKIFFIHEFKKPFLSKLAKYMVLGCPFFCLFRFFRPSRYPIHSSSYIYIHVYVCIYVCVCVCVCVCSPCPLKGFDIGGFDPSGPERITCYGIMSGS